ITGTLQRPLASPCPLNTSSARAGLAVPCWFSVNVGPDFQVTAAKTTAAVTLTISPTRNRCTFVRVNIQKLFLVPGFRRAGFGARPLTDFHHLLNVIRSPLQESARGDEETQPC